MSDLSCHICVDKGSTRIELVRGGLMTVETSTEYNIQSSDGSRLSVRTTKQWTWQAGWQNWLGRLLLTAAAWVLSSTRNEERRVVKTSTQLSHFGCWCNSSQKRDTNNGYRI